MAFLHLRIEVYENVFHLAGNLRADLHALDGLQRAGGGNRLGYVHVADRLCFVVGGLFRLEERKAEQGGADHYARKQNRPPPLRGQPCLRREPGTPIRFCRLIVLSHIKPSGRSILRHLMAHYTANPAPLPLRVGGWRLHFDLYQTARACGFRRD